MTKCFLVCQPLSTHTKANAKFYQSVVPTRKKMKFQYKKQIQFTIRVILSVVVLYDAWTDTIILKQIIERLFEEGIKNDHVKYVTHDVTITGTITFAEILDLKSLENELECKISSRKNEVCQNINETLDKTRVSAKCCVAKCYC